ncbi:MAG: glycosyltransferase [Clostridia bacterium]|nr:glycosyltransferase [Clostridia bacterium]
MGKEPLLFVASCEIDPDVRTGVATKVFNQIAVLGKEYDVYLIAFSKNGILLFHSGKEEYVRSENRRKERIRQCGILCDKYGIRKCYIRFSALEPHFIMMLKALKSRGVDIVMEIPTFPYDDELKDSLKHRVVLLCDRALRGSLKKFVNRIVTYSEDKSIFGIDCINIANGIDVFAQRICSRSEHRDEIVFTGVAKISPWHGYDRMIRGIAMYSGQPDVVFNVVGDGPALEECRSLAEELKVGDRVSFKGFRSGKELDEIYDDTDVGVDCLALHRKGMTRVSSLKSREYAARGLPILTANYFDTIPDDWDYLIKEDADESPINVKHAVDCFLKIRERGEYKKEIRSFAEDKLDINVTFRPVLRYFGTEASEIN